MLRADFVREFMHVRDRASDQLFILSLFLCGFLALMAYMGVLSATHLCLMMVFCSGAGFGMAWATRLPMEAFDVAEALALSG
jgi:hypothetical protein